MRYRVLLQSTSKYRTYFVRSMCFLIQGHITIWRKPLRTIINNLTKWIELFRAENRVDNLFSEFGGEDKIKQTLTLASYNIIRWHPRYNIPGTRYCIFLPFPLCSCLARDIRNVFRVLTLFFFFFLFSFSFRSFRRLYPARWHCPFAASRCTAVVV